MIAYVDSSVVVRLVLGEKEPLEEWEEVDTAVASELVRVECLRALDRVRLRGALSDAALAVHGEALHDLLKRLAFVRLSRPILARASQPFPTSLRTLDAIHLSTALLWREETGDALTVATHDGALALGARAFGLPVVGV